MYLKKIVLFIVFIGLVVGAYFAYYVYNTMFVPNTAFSNQQSFVLIASNDNFEDVSLQLEPLLKDLESFKALAKQKK